MSKEESPVSRETGNELDPKLSRRKVLAAGAVSAAGAAWFSAAASAQQPVVVTPSAAIEAKLMSLDAALNAGDIDAIAAHFAENSVFVGAAGPTRGRSAIRARFALMFGNRYSSAVQNSSLTSIVLLSATTAVATGECAVQGVQTLAGNPVQTLSSTLVATFVQQDGDWLIAAAALVNRTASSAAIEEVRAIA